MNRYGAWNRGWSRGWPGRSAAVRFHHALSTGQHLGGPATSELHRVEAGEGLRVAQGPLARDEPLARLEAVLFLAQEPLSSRKLARLAGLTDGTRARTLVRRLNRLYDAGGWTFRAEEVAGGFQLMSRPKFARWLRRLQPAPVEVRLSPPALETLAVVAYRQPVMRAEIEAVRGVQCDEVLRQLIERDLVRVVGRSEQLGRPFLYGTSKRFLQVFGLRHLDELPQPDSWLAAANEPTTESTTEAAQADAAVQLPKREEDPVSTSLKPQAGEQALATQPSDLPSGGPTVVAPCGEQPDEYFSARDDEEAYFGDAEPEEDDEEYEDEFEDDEEEEEEYEDEDWDEDWEEVEDEDWEEVDDEDWDDEDWDEEDEDEEDEGEEDDEEEDEEEDEEYEEDEDYDEEDYEEDEDEDEYDEEEYEDEDEDDYEEFDDDEDE